MIARFGNACSIAALLWLLLTSSPVAAQVDRVVPLETVQGGVLSLAFSPDGKRLVTAGMDRSIRVWDIEEGLILTTFPRQAGIVRDVAFSPDGTKIASIGDDRSVRLWEISTEKLLKTFEIKGNITVAVAFSPDGKLLAGASTDTHGGHDGAGEPKPTGHIRAWETTKGVLKHSFDVDGAVMGMAFSPDGKRIAGGSRSVHVWDTATGKPVKALKPAKGGTYALAFTPDGTKLVAAGAYRWTDPTTGQAGSRGQIVIWDAKTGAQIHTLEGHSGGVRCIAITPDGRTIASGSSGEYKPFPRGIMKLTSELRLWNTPTGKLRSTLDGGRDDGSTIWSVSFSPDGKTLAVADDQRLIVRDAETLEIRQILLETKHQRLP